MQTYRVEEGIDRFSAYAGKINKDFVHWDFI
jgi:hypothetical protein